MRGLHHTEDLYSGAAGECSTAAAGARCLIQSSLEASVQHA